MRTDLLRRLEGFHEDYFFAGEMADLCSRARELGFGSWIVPAAEAVHDLDAAGSHRDTLYRYYSLRNRFLFAERRVAKSARRRVRLLWTLRGLARVLIALFRGRIGRARSLWIAVVDGRAGRFGRASESRVR